MTPAEVSPNPQEPNSLYTAQPTPGTLLDLRMKLASLDPTSQEHNELAELLQLDEKHLAFRTAMLSDFDRVGFTMGDLYPVIHLAFSLGDLELMRLIEIRRYYEIPIVHPETRADEIMIDRAFAEGYKAQAIEVRDHALQLRRDGKGIESDRVLALAEASWWNYTTHATWAGDIQATLTFKEVAAIGNAELDRLLDKAEVVDYFFSETVISAYEAFQQALDDILEGTLSIDGVNRRWISVWSEVTPNREKYPQGEKEMNKVKQFVAQEHGVTVEDLDRFARFRVEEMFPSSPENS